MTMTPEEMLTPDELQRIAHTSEHYVDDAIDRAVTSGEKLSLTDVAARVANIDGVASATAGDDGTTLSYKVAGSDVPYPVIVVRADDDRLFGPYTHRPPNSSARMSAASTPNESSLRTTSVPRGNGRALILQAETAGDLFFSKSVEQSLESVGYEITKHERNGVNSKTTRADYMAQFDVVIIVGHGDVDGFRGNYVEYLGGAKLIHSQKLRDTIGDSRFRDTYVVVLSCRSADNNDNNGNTLPTDKRLGDTFLSLGAGAFTGFSYYVNVGVGRAIVRTLVYEMTENERSLSDASDFVRSDHPDIAFSSWALQAFGTLEQHH